MATVRADDGVEIYYETWGRRDGEPLLLVPGLGADRRVWACQRLVFGRRFRCVAVDNRGSGRSGKPPGPYSLVQMAADARAVLDGEGIASAHVLGSSMGATTAAVLAVAEPPRVRSLVLAGSACGNPAWRKELLAGWMEIAGRHGVHVMARRAFPWLLGPGARRFGLWINLVWPLVLSQPAHAFAGQVQAILEVADDARLGLSAIAAPTLVLVGGEDRLTPPGEAAEVAALVPGARLEVIAGAGHGLMLEAAWDFNAAALDFLAGVSSRQPA